VNKQGENAGYDIAIAKQLAQSLLGDARKLRLVTLDPANRVAFLQTRKVDLVLANFTVTPERAAVVDFGRPYMKTALGLVAPEKGPVRGIRDLKGHKLIITKGTTAEVYFTRLLPELDPLKFDQNSEAFQALLDGRGDAFAQDNVLLFSWAASHPGYRVVEGNLGNADVIAPAVRKGDTELLLWVNRELERLGREGGLRRAYEEELRPFFGTTVSDPAQIILE